MNTVEMINMWKEDTSKKFKCVGSMYNEDVGGIVSNVKHRLCWDGCYNNGLYIASDDMIKWELIIEPIDFITAYNNCLSSNKLIEYRGESYKGDFLIGSGIGSIYTSTKDENGELKLTQRWILQQ